MTPYVDKDIWVVNKGFISNHCTLVHHPIAHLQQVVRPAIATWYHIGWFKSSTDSIKTVEMPNIYCDI